VSDAAISKRTHFVGIGGIGMSAIAALLLERGQKVSGSDIKATNLTDAIKDQGGEISIGQRPENITKAIGLLVYSSCIDDKNPELIKAKSLGIKIVHRSDILAQLVNEAKGIAVTGAHGKTTTSALCSLMLIKAGLDPTVLIGGEADFLNGNWRSGKSDLVICEADESDGSFQKIKSEYGIITNIDREHLDYYKDFNAIIKANRNFIKNIKKGGCLITSYDDANMKKLIKGYRYRLKTYAKTKADADKADIFADNIRMDKSGSIFNVVFHGKNIGEFQLRVPGEHNCENSLAVILLGLELGIDTEIIKESLAQYKGIQRRFEIKGRVNDITVIEDYAHHPAEIIATISACKNWSDKRLIGVFQPHRYTRTKFLKREFGKSFFGLDELILTDIYSASEKPLKGVTTGIIYDEVVKNGQKNVQLIKKEKILRHLMKILRKKDMVLILGAGDIGELSGELVKRLEAKKTPVA